MRYFIIGYKNSGKTTFGRKLAEMLNMSFVDLDEYIEQLTGESIPDLYTRLGDSGFRKLEMKHLRMIVKTDNEVISTGGGAPCHCDNMSFMERHGQVIYLMVSMDTLIRRLRKASSDRPIVKGKTEEELRSYLADLQDKCGHIYARAHHIVDGDCTNWQAVMSMLSQAGPG